MADLGSPAPIAVLDHYRSLLESDPSVWDAMSWTVIVDPADEALLLSRLSDNYVSSEAIDFDDLCDIAMDGFDHADDSPHNSRAWLVRAGGSVGLLEVNGFAASMPPTLVPLSRACASVASVYWNEAIGRCHLSFAQDGLVEFMDVIGEDHHDPDELGVLALPLAAVSVVAGEDDGHEAISMAVTELITGIRLDDAIMARKWPMIEFRMRELH